MVLEIREVSRKTPRDGRLEITEDSARRLAGVGTPLTLVVGAEVAPAELDALDCQCDKGGTARTGSHRHHFLRSSLLMQLTVGESIVVELDADGLVVVSRPHPLRPA